MKSAVCEERRAESGRVLHAALVLETQERCIGRRGRVGMGGKFSS